MRVCIVTLSMVFFLAACSSNQPSDNQASDDFQPIGAAESLKQAEFSALSEEHQYLVANKILGMMQKGLPVDTFFDISQGFETLDVKETNFINDLRANLTTELSISEKNAINDLIYGIDPTTGVASIDNAYYKFTYDTEPKLLPLAQIQQYPISRDMFAVWMAHFLANTILFSPAYEMDATDEVDVARVMTFLELEILAGTPVREIIYKFLPNLSRWRVSRSAENHALEAMEMYLGDFDADEDAIKGGIACQEYYLTEPESGNQLRRSPYRNDTTMVILDEFIITTCDDFYRVIANHPVTLTRVTDVIVNYFLNGRPYEERLAVVQSIVDSGATTFEDIFKGVLFSKAFLLETENPASMENTLLSLYDRLRADRVASHNLNTHFLLNLVGYNDDNEKFNPLLNLDNANWATADYKIGRLPEVSLDVLSFSSYSRAVREVVIAGKQDWRGGLVKLNNIDANPWVNHKGLIYEAYSTTQNGELNARRVRPDIDAMTLEAFLDYLFLTALSRRATDIEKHDLIEYLHARSFIYQDTHTGNWIINGRSDAITYHDEIAQTVLDYASILPEFYYQKRVQ